MYKGKSETDFEIIILCVSGFLYGIEAIIIKIITVIKVLFYCFPINITGLHIKKLSISLEVAASMKTK